MICPLDSTVLVVSERSGVEIDYCPQCRGVWLDRGELDKILERDSGGRRPSYDSRPPSDRHQGQDGKRRREGFLGDLFDF